MTNSKASPTENTGSSDDWEDADEPWTLRALKRGERETLARWLKYRLPAVTPLASFADYAAAAEKRTDIARARTVSETELRKAATEIARGFAARQDDQTDKHAQAILDGRANEAFEGFEELKSQKARVSQQLKAYGVALRTQDGIVAEIRSERSIDAADAMRPAHQAAVADIAVAVAQLREAFDREEAARTLVTNAGYDGRLPSFSPGTAMRQGGQLDEIERRAREYTR